MPVATPDGLNGEPLRIHFWTPHSAWPSALRQVGHVVPHLRVLVGARGWPWQISAGPELPLAVDWLLCLKAVPPPGRCPVERTVLLVCDDADRVWGKLARFGHIVSVASPVLAALIGAVHPRVWFIEETESAHTIAQGQQALAATPPSRRDACLMWHGLRGSLNGLLLLREVLEEFGRESGAELAVVTNRPAGAEKWGALNVRWVAWSPESLAATAAAARLGLVPARPTLADSYLKSAGRLRCLFALGCPAIGDSRSPDVVEFSRACGLPAAQTPAEWLAVLRELWHAPTRLDEVARRGHGLVQEQFTAARTAAQWLWFLAGGAQSGR